MTVRGDVSAFAKDFLAPVRILPDINVFPLETSVFFIIFK